MKMRELFSPIPKEIFRKDDVRERVEIFLVLFVVAGFGYKFVKGSINAYLSLDDHNIALAVFANAAVAAAFLLAYLLMCWVIRLGLCFVYEMEFPIQSDPHCPIENDPLRNWLESIWMKRK